MFFGHHATSSSTDFMIFWELHAHSKMLRVRRIVVTVTQCAVIAKPRNMRSLRSVSDSAPAADIIVEKVIPQKKSARPNAFALFPWREVSLPPNGIVQTVHNLLSIVFVRMTTVGFTMAGSLTKYSHFIAGGEAAFRCATDSIFYHQLMEKHRKQVNSLSSGTIAPETRDVADLSEIFGEELQAFYRYAIEQHCLKSTYNCTYSLQSIRSVTISSMEYIKGTLIDRKQKYHKQVAGPGLAYIVLTKYSETNLFTATQEERIAMSKDMSGCVNMIEGTVRVWLDVECTGSMLLFCKGFHAIPCPLCMSPSIFLLTAYTEVLAIRDTATGATVQGTLLPRQVTHQVGAFLD